MAARATGDVDGDGRSDLVVLYSDYGVSYATVFSGDGTGTLSKGVTYSLPPGADVVLSDLDGDQHADLIVGGPIGTYVFSRLPGR